MRKAGALAGIQAIPAVRGGGVFQAWRKVLLGLALLVLGACVGTPTLDTAGAEDLDGDGMTLLEGDCNDRNPQIYAGGVETCDGLDNDCDTLIDEDVTQIYYQDNDLDSFGAGMQFTGGCRLEPGQSSNNLDCDDRRADVYPAAPEVCDDVDNSCDGVIDTDTPDQQKRVYYEDIDEDGYGDAELPVYACDLEPPDGTVDNFTDCDDAAAHTFPGADEVCDGRDNDCDEQIDEDFIDGSGVVRCEQCNGLDDDGVNGIDDGFDFDGDGFTSPTDCAVCLGSFETCGQDCDDQNPEVNPEALEVCDANNIDEDCDGKSDDEDADVVRDDADIWYLDRDLDGYGTGSSSYRFCDPPPGYAEVPGDCNDSKASIHPDAEEKTNDGIDQNCDGYEICYVDFDDDGYRPDNVQTIMSSTLDCTGDRAASNMYPSGDCDDTDPLINPVSTERCNLADDDCDGKVDEDAFDPTIAEVCNSRDDDCDGQIDEEAGEQWYRDGDGDGYGDVAMARKECTAPVGYVGNDDDCDDSVRTTYPEAAEHCNGVDDDCDGAVDESAVDTLSWYQDLDEDGFGNRGNITAACEQPEGFVDNNFDCDDSDGAINPLGQESCNEQDDDCDGKVDEEVTNVCGRCGVVPAEICNGTDDDCNGIVDDGVGSAWYQDRDGDLYGVSTSVRVQCDQPGGYAGKAGDCNDSDPKVNPGGTETCNGVDDDCNSVVDDNAQGTTTYYLDADRDGYGNALSTTKACSKPDGYSTASTDCNDNNASIHPNATETCNNADDDCDAQVDEGGLQSTYYLDGDADGYGVSSTTKTACGAPTGYASQSGDCNDANAAIHPGAAESCNSIDDDCDGQVDNNASTGTTWYLDSDADTYGDSTQTKTGCDAPAGYVGRGGDCDDTRATVYPGAAEECNGRDDNCDGTGDASAVACERTFTIDQKAELCPGHRSGDREFDGNGPDVLARATIYVGGASDTIELEIYFQAYESDNKDTKTWDTWYYTVYQAPDGCTIPAILSTTSNSWSYTDTDTDLDSKTYSSDNLVQEWQIQGDGDGDDVEDCVEYDDATEVRLVSFHPSKIRLACSL